jgi:hypothetical protein
MGLDLTKLEKVRPHGTNIIARCPACAQDGKDGKGEHLCIYPDGRFACVVYPSVEGKNHRKRIFELIGLDERRSGFRVKQVRQLIQQPIIKNVLGHLGRLNLTLAYNPSKSSVENKSQRQSEYNNAVPAVPNINCNIFTLDELTILKDVDPESLRNIAEVKRIFNGTVIQATDKNTNDLGNF